MRDNGTTSIIHELKIWPQYYEAVRSGKKTFEKRSADRDYQVGDFLKLREWDPETKEYTGRIGYFKVTYILDGPFADHGEVLMSIEPEAVD